MMGSCYNGFINDNNEIINKWRNYFRKINNDDNSDIFEIIEQAIMVAALDCPKEFILRRVRIVELLFSCRLTNNSNTCLGCDSVELAQSRVSHRHDHGGGGGGSKGSKVNSSCGNNDDHHHNGVDDDDMEIMDNINVVNKDSSNNNKVGLDGVLGSCERGYRLAQNNKDNLDGVWGSCEREYHLVQSNKGESNFSFGDAEALTYEIEQEREIVGEVLRIKEIMHNYRDESDAVLFESLRRLQLMALNVDILKETEIGKAVNAIRKHGSKQTRHLARLLIDGWKVIVDEWVKATEAIAEGGTPDSINPSTLDEEEGLPSPPLDEAAFLATPDMELSQENFFDGIDDYGNSRNFGELSKNREVRRNPIVVNQDGPRRREERPKEATPITRENKVQKISRQAPVAKPNRPSNLQSRLGRPLQANDEVKAINDNATQHRPTKPIIKRNPPSQPERLRSSNEATIESKKFETAKRKIEKRYLEAELAKKMRTSKVIDIHDLPKQGAVKKNTQGRFGNIRNGANRRR